MRGGRLGIVLVLVLLGASFAASPSIAGGPKSSPARQGLPPTASMRGAAKPGSGTPQVVPGVRSGLSPPAPDRPGGYDFSAGGLPGPSAPVLLPAPSGSRGPLLVPRSRPLPPTLLPSGVGSAQPHRSARVAVELATNATPDTTAAAGFQGLNSSCADCFYVPPDVQVAAGLSYIVEMVNLGGAIYTRQGQLVTSFSLYNFPFAFPGSDGLSDPKILYDSSTDRWFATLLDFTAGDFKLSVSTTSNPNAAWVYYTIIGTPAGDFPDQPTLGVSANLVAVGADDFNMVSSTFDGGQFWVLNKTELVAGATTSYVVWGPSCGTGCTLPGSIHPVRSLSSTTTQYFVTSGEGTTSFLGLYSVVGTPPGTVTLSSQTLSIQPLSNPPPAPQAGSANTLDPGDGRVLDALWFGGNLWATFADACTPPQDTQVRSCFRLIELNTAGPTVTIDRDWGSPGLDYLYPALSLDYLGDVTIVVGDSSATQYPGLSVVGQAYNEPGSLDPGITPPGLSPSGPATYPKCSGTCRYGDYFGAATDPGRTSVWIAGEYGAAGTLWSTYIAQATTSPLAVPRVSASPSSTDAGQSTTFTASPSGGTGGYGYAWAGLPPGCSGGNQSSVACGTPAAGSYTVSVTVNDSYGTTVASPTLAFTVYPDPSVTSPTSAPLSSGIDVGQAVTFSASASAGSGGYSFSWLGLPGCPSSNLSSLPCTATAAGTFSVGVSVTDSNRFTVSSSLLPFVVLPDPVVAAPTLSRHSLDVGQGLNLSVTATGGAGSFSYVWNGLPPGCSGSSATLSCLPSVVGFYNLSVSVTDANAFAVTSPGSALTVSPSLTATLTAAPESFLQGLATNLSVTVQGGSPDYTYVWSGLPPGCETPASPAAAHCTPSQAGTYRILVTVTDRNGAAVSSAVQLVVEPSLLGLPLLVGSSVIGGLIIAVVVAAIVVVTRRRKKRS